MCNLSAIQEDTCGLFGCNGFRKINVAVVMRAGTLAVEYPNPGDVDCLSRIELVNVPYRPREKQVWERQATRSSSFVALDRVLLRDGHQYPGGQRGLELPLLDLYLFLNCSVFLEAAAAPTTTPATSPSSSSTPSWFTRRPPLPTQPAASGTSDDATPAAAAVAGAVGGLALVAAIIVVIVVQRRRSRRIDSTLSDEVGGSLASLN